MDRGSQLDNGTDLCLPNGDSLGKFDVVEVHPVEDKILRDNPRQNDHRIKLNS